MADTKVCHVVIRKNDLYGNRNEKSFNMSSNYDLSFLHIMKSHQVIQKCEKKIPDEIALRLDLTITLSTTTKMKQPQT